MLMEGGSLLRKLEIDNISNLVLFICHVEKKKGDTKKILEWNTRV